MRQEDAAVVVGLMTVMCVERLRKGGLVVGWRGEEEFMKSSRHESRECAIDM